MPTKVQLANVVRYAKEHYGVTCSWARVGKLIDRVGYKYVARTLIQLKPELQFNDGNHFINYIQKIATDMAIKESDG